MGGARRGKPGPARIGALAGCVGCRRPWQRRVPLPGGDDAARRAGAAAGRVRLARRSRHQAGERLGKSALRAGLRRRHDGDRLSVERRDRRGSDAGGLCCRDGGRGRAAPLSLRLCVHRQRGELRAADLQPGQSRRLRQPHAAAAILAGGGRPAIAAVDRSDLRRASVDPAQGAPSAHRRTSR